MTAAEVRRICSRTWLSTADLATELGISRIAIWRWRTGRLGITAANAAKLKALVAVPRDVLRERAFKRWCGDSAPRGL